MIAVEREHECVQALPHDAQVRMAGLGLAGWSFRCLAGGAWIAQKPGWFDHYGTSLLACIASVTNNSQGLPPDRRPLWRKIILPDAAETRPGAPGKK